MAFSLVLTLTSASILGGCVTDIEKNPKQTVGRILGAGLGALTGSQIGSGKGQMVSVAVGALAGAWLGGEIGGSLDKADRAYMQRNTQESLEHGRTGSTSSWRNPDSGNSGTVTLTQTFQKADGQYCREFEQTVYVDGKKEAATGRACRAPDGSWKIIS
ncbi:MAG: hypothetical protein CMF67_05855 [Magnetovibrio sp.]|nr:hypothetical protein [Magnetovibrio sp.]